MRIGILTGGGDAPGLNGIIESATRSLLNQGHQVIGIQDGFEGIFDARYKNLTYQDVLDIHGKPGTILGTSNRCGTTGREQEFLAKYNKICLDGLIAAGGDGTFLGLAQFKNDINLIGVPKTIDNDLSGTDITFGYDTACKVVAEAVDSLQYTASAHRRIIFVETMGRTAGWIALGGGMASYADAILVPERPYDPQKLLNIIKRKKADGQRGIVCVVAEGAHAQGEQAHVAFKVAGSPEPQRLGGIAEHLARWVEQEIGEEARHVVLGHLQRSAPPSSTDRFLTLAMGVQVAQLVEQEKWGYAASYINGRVEAVPITDFMQGAHLIDQDHRWIKICQQVGIFVS